jgi:hypothetical protein
VINLALVDAEVTEATLSHLYTAFIDLEASIEITMASATHATNTGRPQPVPRTRTGWKLFHSDIQNIRVRLLTM